MAERFDFKCLNWIVTMDRAHNQAKGARTQLDLIFKLNMNNATRRAIEQRASIMQENACTLYERARALYAEGNDDAQH